MQHVRQFLTDLHARWPTASEAELAAFYHPEVVLLPPDMGRPICGRGAVVASYREFVDAAELLSFDITELLVFPFSSDASTTHMAHLQFRIEYLLDAERYVERGLEVYALLEQAGQLQIIWRSQTVLDSRLAAKSAPHQ